MDLTRWQIDQLRTAVANGAGHDCLEWRTCQNRCLLCDRVLLPLVPAAYVPRPRPWWRRLLAR